MSAADEGVVAQNKDEGQNKLKSENLEKQSQELDAQVPPGWTKVDEQQDGSNVYIRPLGKGDYFVSLDILLKEVSRELDEVMAKAKRLTFRKEALKAAIEALK